MTVYELIEKHEGRKKKPYRCTAGKRTIGVGYNYDDNTLPPDIAAYLKDNGQVTDEMIDRLLEITVRQAVADCHVLFPEFDSFSDNRRMALTDFVFQLGFKRARGFSKSIAAVNTGRWFDAAREMEKSSWFYQVPKRAAEIINMIEEG